MAGNLQDVAYLYRITNAVNGMQYIGVSKNPTDRLRRHGTKANPSRKSILKNAIHKYGMDNFKMEVLVQSTLGYCFDLEKKAIEALGTRSPSGYNITAGGEGYTGFVGEDHHMYGVKRSQEWRDYMSNLFTGRPIPPEQRAKISASLKGNKHSAETIEKRTKAITGLKRSKESVARMIASKTGKTFSAEVRENMRIARNNRSSDEGYKKQSEAMKARWNDPEFREKMRLVLARKKEVKNV
jgi:group I intron endonuclease